MLVRAIRFSNSWLKNSLSPEKLETTDSTASTGQALHSPCNIIGSTLGSFVVGYILMDIWPVRSIAIALAITGLALGASMLIASEKGFSRRALAVGISCGLAVAIVAASGPLFSQ